MTVLISRNRFLIGEEWFIWTRMISSNKKMKVRKIIFVTRNSQVDIYLDAVSKNSNLNCSDSLFVALNSVVYAYLIQHKLPCKNTLDYFRTDSQVKVLDKSKILTDWLRQNIDIVESEFGFSYALRETAVFLIRSRLNFFLKFIEIINNTLDAYSPEIVLASVPDKNYASGKFLTFDDNYLGQIVRLAAENRLLKFEEIVENKNKLSAPIARFFFDLSKFIFKWLEFSLWDKKRQLGNFRYKGRTILLTTRRYNMDRLAEKLKGADKENKAIFMSQFKDYFDKAELDKLK